MAGAYILRLSSYAPRGRLRARSRNMSASTRSLNADRSRPRLCCELRAQDLFRPLCERSANKTNYNPGGCLFSGAPLCGGSPCPAGLTPWRSFENQPSSVPRARTMVRLRQVRRLAVTRALSRGRRAILPPDYLKSARAQCALEHRRHHFVMLGLRFPESNVWTPAEHRSRTTSQPIQLLVRTVTRAFNGNGHIRPLLD
jgi:hypothetical protein